MKTQRNSDIFFCVDYSGTMSYCIEGVKKHISDFIYSLENQEYNGVINWQLGFCSYSSKAINFLDLKDNISSFINAMDTEIDRGSEFTPGAIDYIINNASWRINSNKYIIIFTDEDIRGGRTLYHPDGGIKEFSQLVKKISDSKIKIFFFGKECPYFRQIETCEGSQFIVVDDYHKIDFRNFLKNLGINVSKSYSDSTTTLINTTPIYNLNDYWSIKKLF